MINWCDLFKRIQKYRVTDDKLLPWAYQKANPQGRPLHNDWALWPFTRIPRILTAYRLPMPAKQIAGNVVPRWFPVQDGYPLVPNTEIRMLDYNGVQKPHIFGVDPYLNPGQWSVQAVWLDEWIECYHTSSRMFWGKKLSTNRGLRPDITLGDFCWWYPEAGLTWTN